MPRPPRADDSCQHRERALEGRSTAEVNVVHQQVRSSLDFGDAGKFPRNRVSASAARGDNRGRDTRAFKQSRRLHQFATASAYDLIVFGTAGQSLQVSIVAHHTPDSKAALDGKARQIERRIDRVHATPVHADVHIHQDLNLRVSIPLRPRQIANRVAIVGSHHDLRAARQFGQPFRFLLACDLVGDKDAAYSVLHQDLSFPNGRAGHPDGPGAQLLMGQQRRLVILEVWPQFGLARSKERGHVAQVRLHGVQVHQQRRCFDLFHLHGIPFLRVR